MFGTEVGGVTPLIYRNDLLRAVIYTDSDDPADLSGNGADGTYDRVEYRYNRQSERIAMKDQNETAHSYTFDKRGRSLADEVLSFGTGVDQAVAKIARTYNVQGQVELITSYDGSSNVVNQVKQEYNAFGQLMTDWQQHDGPVTAASPRVGYTYADASAGHTRLTAMTYPNGRLLHFGYAAGADDAFNRVSWLADDNGSGSPGTHLAEYTYLGLGGIVQVDYAEPQIRYDLDHGTVGTYAGLDEFGRAKDLLWRNYGTSQDVVRIKHGYDRAGNRLWREDAVAAAQSPPVHLDELYTYDGINRLVDAARGDLNANKDGLVPGTKTFAEAWGLDSTGNWSSFNQDTTGGGWALEQTRDHSPVNEIADIDETAGPSWVTPTHDRAGNMTVIPQPASPTGSFELTWDAWDRLVKVEDGADTVAEYQYDGRGFRTVKFLYVDGQLDHSRSFHHTSQWQVLDERVDGSTNPAEQYVWGLRYMDDQVLRDRDPIGNGQLDGRLYALQDAIFSMSAVTDDAGAVQERYVYAMYGLPTFMHASFATGTTHSSNGWHYLFTGRQLDSETGLYYYRARYYDGALGRFLTGDPIQADQNLYRYCGNNPVLLVDPSGLRWIVNRDGDSLAECCPENAGDTLATLANQVGLDPADANKWLTQKDGRYFVPNTIYVVWAGDNVPILGIDLGLGKRGVSWGADVKYLQKRGFNVVNVDTPADFAGMLGNASNNRTLHGLFFWGHGAPDRIANRDTTWVVTYASLVGQLQYKMGFAMLNACFSDHERGDANITFWFPNKPLTLQTFVGPLDFGGRNLVEPNPNGIFAGAPSVLSPFQRLPFLKTRLPGIFFNTAWHPSDKLKRGDQATKP